LPHLRGSLEKESALVFWAMQRDSMLQRNARQAAEDGLKIKQSAGFFRSPNGTSHRP
jgi:hypothetical protein